MVRASWHGVMFLCAAIGIPHLGWGAADNDPRGAATPTAKATCDVRSVGAVGDGQTLDTAALQSAIDRVSTTGGGTVDLPPGRYLSGTLILRDGVTLNLQAGATLLGSTNFADYRNGTVTGRALPVSAYGQNEAEFPGLVIAVGARDIAVTGQGTLDGQGAAVAAAIHQLQVDKKLAGNPKSRPDEKLRPCLLNLINCSNVRVEGVTLRDAACWVENYTNCSQLTVDHVTVRSQAFWNNDGIDISGCQHVRVTHCDIDSADDGICLKSNASPCDDVVVRDCRVRSWANAIKFGTVSFQAFKHITIDHVEALGSGHAGLSIESVDGAVIDDVTLSNLTLRNLRAGILIKLGDRHKPDGKVGAIRNITLSDVNVELADGDPDKGQKFHAPVPSYPHNSFPCIVSGLPDHPIEQVTLRRVTFRTPGGGLPTVANVPLDQVASIRENSKGYPEYGMHGELPAFGWYVRHATDLAMDAVTVRCDRADFRSAAVLDDVSGAAISGLRVSNPGGESPVIALNRVRRATVSGGEAMTAAAAFVQTLADCSDTTATNNRMLKSPVVGQP